MAVARDGHRMKKSAGGGGRTRTLLREPDFESGASASSATPAWKKDAETTEPAAPWQAPRRSPTRVVALAGEEIFQLLAAALHALTDAVEEIADAAEGFAGPRV